MSDTDIKSSWLCSWIAPPLNADAEVLPKKIPLAGNTVRHQIKLAAGGEKIRLTFSNEYSETLAAPDCALELRSVHIARLAEAGKPDIVAGSDVAVTFSGHESASVPAGSVLTSDAVDFPTDDLGMIAVTVCFGDLPEYPACHREADCSSWLMSGAHPADDFSPEEYLWSYFSLCRADVFAPESRKTLVCFGDSITDGAVSTFNGFDAWPNLLAASLLSDSNFSHISAVDSAIAGNAIYGGWGEPAVDRFKRDVLDVPGVGYAAVLIGTNDIPGAVSDITNGFISAYSGMISECHKAGIKIYGGTITPFGNNEHWASDLHERIRTQVNGWIMSPESGFDGYVDFASAVADPADRTKLRPDCDSGDGLHPSAKGHAEMGAAAISALKKLI